MKIKTKYINYTFILLPFVLIFVSEMISFRNQSLGSLIKFISVIYMFLYSILKLRFDSKLIFSFLFFLLFFCYHIVISFNINAAIEEGIRYLFPIIILYYSYSIRKQYKLILTFIVLYALLNNLYQPISYVNWLLDVKKQWFYYQVRDLDIYYYNGTMGIMRGVGLIGFFATYGFLNLVAFFIVKLFYFGKRRNLLLLIFLLGLISSLSFKALGGFVFLMFILSKYKTKLVLTGLSIFFTFITFFPKKTISLTEQLTLRVERYITEGNSARAESYRVMFDDIKGLNILGRGAGSFGGASSTKYNSPVYEEVNFNWYDTIFLTTTDTYYPHLIVELGIIGGFLYILILIIPLYKRKYIKEIFLMLFVIYFSLFFDSLFSFALNNLGYLMLSLTLIYPILEYEKQLLNNNKHKF